MVRVSRPDPERPQHADTLLQRRRCGKRDPSGRRIRAVSAAALADEKQHGEQRSSRKQ
jgi:hypothetical protein